MKQVKFKKLQYFFKKISQKKAVSKISETALNFLLNIYFIRTILFTDLNSFSPVTSIL